ncbi:BZ3500_MvSof-1268-A1-R1_Chr1-3g02142 [Microbotryum saponariae]|uniref:BZ3500_MvSof-1268-A1-R1_Chr1-3g02142 protein n=1 Tax=Microbotryum saponariae TaxID=289078 RepID=A0A2X0KGF6_9BASI|nr:BZ3500_MvSof-1268-A1-R1_Chr1-3g02142 [Microbotryum saponariae]SCZ95497.1 BZ3501_MvSof-1269-A2-R1_Chr1-3g01745 [Microbotryum saponariae]
MHTPLWLVPTPLHDIAQLCTLAPHARIDNDLPQAASLRNLVRVSPFLFVRRYLSDLEFLTAHPGHGWYPSSLPPYEKFERFTPSVPPRASAPSPLSSTSARADRARTPHLHLLRSRPPRSFGVAPHRPPRTSRYPPTLSTTMPPKPSTSRLVPSLRLYATSSFAPGSQGAGSPGSPFVVFDRQLKRLQRNRAARDPEKSRLTDYIKDEVAANMVDRLLDIKRRFPLVLDIGSGPGYIAKHLDPEITQKVVMTDSSRNMLYRDQDHEFDVPIERIVCDEEALPFEENSHDAIMSCLALHWVNDLPGTLIQIRRALRPDGVFIGSMLGGDTLFELRTALQLAEIEREGGISPRISPMTNSQSITSLLNRAGFNLATVDVDEIDISYPSMFELVEDLKWMGESNAVINRRSRLNPDTLLAAASIYRELHGHEDGTIPATFQIMHMVSSDFAAPLRSWRR